MNKAAMKEFETLFIELKKNIVNEMATLDHTYQKGDDVDLSLEDRQRTLDLKILGRQSFMLKKIDNALLKIKDGTFGSCDECGCDIEINRLRARPVATQCIGCKEESEKQEKEMLYEKRSHTHGKGFNNSNVIPLRNENNTLKTALTGSLD